MRKAVICVVIYCKLLINRNFCEYVDTEKGWN